MPNTFLPTPWLPRLIELFSEPAATIRVACPFIKASIIQQLLSVIPRRESPTEVRLLTRLNPDDCLSRVLDASVLSLFAANPFPDDVRLVARFNNLLHSKVFIFDASKLIVTSSNLTGAGLLTNIESGIMTDDPAVIASAIEYFDTQYDRSGAVDRDRVRELVGQMQTRSRVQITRVTTSETRESVESHDVTIQKVIESRRDLRERLQTIADARVEQHALTLDTASAMPVQVHSSRPSKAISSDELSELMQTCLPGVDAALAIERLRVHELDGRAQWDRWTSSLRAIGQSALRSVIAGQLVKYSLAFESMELTRLQFVLQEIVESSTVTQPISERYASTVASVLSAVPGSREFPTARRADMFSCILVGIIAVCLGPRKALQWTMDQTGILSGFAQEFFDRRDYYGELMQLVRQTDRNRIRLDSGEIRSRTVDRVRCSILLGERVLATGFGDNRRAALRQAASRVLDNVNWRPREPTPVIVRPLEARILDRVLGTGRKVLRRLDMADLPRNLAVSALVPNGSPLSEFAHTREILSWAGNAGCGFAAQLCAFSLAPQLESHGAVAATVASRSSVLRLATTFGIPEWTAGFRSEKRLQSALTDAASIESLQAIVGASLVSDVDSEALTIIADATQRDATAFLRSTAKTDQ